MRHICKIVIIGMLFLVFLPICAQENNNEANNKMEQRSPRLTKGQRNTSEEDKHVRKLSVRAQEFNSRLVQDVSEVRWSRVIYRELDLIKEENAPLYYPVRPLNNQKNLFSVIFDLLKADRIKAYEYLDGYEVFDEDHLVNFKDLLDRYHIFYEEKQSKNGKDVIYKIEDSDIPSEEVKSYYVKEIWYFDQNNSVFDVKISAICPILFYNGDLGETRMPMFWLPYEQIRPYINSTRIMVSNLNNAANTTVDDYFRKRMFKGEIIKTQNLLNRPLQAYCPTPDSLKNEQQRIENQLASFEEKLWLKQDSIIVSTQNVEKKQREVKKSRATRSKVKTKTVKPTQSTRSVRSVRSVRRR